MKIPLYMGGGGAAATFRTLALVMLPVPPLLVCTAAIIGCSRELSSFSLSAVSSRCWRCLRIRSLSFSSLSSGWCLLKFSSLWEAEPGLVDGVLPPLCMELGVRVRLSMLWLNCALGVLSVSVPGWD